MPGITAGGRFAAGVLTGDCVVDCAGGYGSLGEESDCKTQGHGDETQNPRICAKFS